MKVNRTKKRTCHAQVTQSAPRNRGADCSIHEHLAVDMWVGVPYGKKTVTV